MFPKKRPKELCDARAAKRTRGLMPILARPRRATCRFSRVICRSQYLRNTWVPKESRPFSHTVYHINAFTTGQMYFKSNRGGFWGSQGVESDTSPCTRFRWTEATKQWENTHDGKVYNPEQTRMPYVFILTYFITSNTNTNTNTLYSYSFRY